MILPHNQQTIKKYIKSYKKTHNVLNWFQNNSVVANPGKFQIMFLGSLINYYSITFLVENNQTKSNTSSKSLRAMERIEKFFIPRASKTSF